MDNFGKKSDQAVAPRQIDEEIVNNKIKKPESGFVETDALKLLHELEESHAELVMLKEGLQQANAN